MKTMRHRLCFALLLLLIPFAAPPAHAQDEVLSGLDAYISEGIDAWEIPGLAIAVVEDDSIVFAEGYGVRELGEPAEVTPRTLFAIGSASKAFTAAALAMLVDAGKLEWDDAVTEYLPRFQLFDPWVTRELTVRDLLTHNSGLPGADLFWYATAYDSDEILRRVRFLEPTSSFRSQYGYHNIMYLAAGQIIPAITGMSWDEFIDERIFTPLEMQASTTGIIPLRDRQNAATSHAEIEGNVRPIPYHDFDDIAPAGAISSNVLEMANWVELQLNHGVYEGDTLISPAVFEEMHTPQTIIPTQGLGSLTTPKAHFLSYGMGWFLSDYHGRKIVQHGGNVVGMHSLVAMMPEEDVGLVVLTNTGSNFLTYALMHRVFDAYLGMPTTDWSARMLATVDSLDARAEERREAMLAKRVPGTSPSLPLEAYTGTYNDEMYGDVMVRLEDGELVLHLSPALTADLEHWHYNTFRAAWHDPLLGKAFVTFRLGPMGEVTSLVSQLLGEFQGVPEQAARTAASEAAPRPATDYSAVVRQLERLIAHEMRDEGLPAVSIALVDGQRIVWADGFGWEAPQDSIPATAETVYRVGSVSKLFTDIAIMQLVEEGALDLDAPVSRYLPDFQPHNPYDRSITLRQLMSHRSGLVREPPVGHYFDSTEPSLAETVHSLNRTTLVYEPGTRTKYSNAGIATVGYVLQQTQDVPFARYLRHSVLAPMGMEHSAFRPRPELVDRLATAYMWTYDGRSFEAPTFQLGEAPAGSMYTTVKDLGRFLTVLFAGGRGPGGQVLEPETLERMWTPQFTAPGDDTGYGIGFYVSELDGHRRVGHGGAIYGFATQLAALPDEELGVVVVASRDITNAVVGRIADVALRLMLAARAGEPLPEIRTTSPVPPALSRRLEGRYGRGPGAVELRERAGRLFLWALRGGTRVELKSTGGALIADGRLGYGLRVVPLEDAIVVRGDTLERVAVSKPQPAPERWAGLIGEYGWDYDTLYILEKDGRLHALIEWFFLYPLEQVADNVFRFPDRSLYAGERVVFTRDASGRATEVTIGGSVVFERRAVGPEGGETFRITPVRPVDELRRIALAAEPPRESRDFREPDLVPVTALDSTIKLDIRYATTNNFMSTVFYEEPHAFLQRPAAEALVRAHRSLKQKGYGLLIHDAYRPWFVTKMFWDATPADKKLFVADPAEGSRHNRGAAVDLTLYDLDTGEPVQMVSGYDEFSPRAFPGYPGATSLQRWHRELLREAMGAQGFTVYQWEWWHFDYKDWDEYPIMNKTFDEVLENR